MKRAFYNLIHEIFTLTMTAGYLRILFVCLRLFNQSLKKEASTTLRTTTNENKTRCWGQNFASATLLLRVTGGGCVRERLGVYFAIQSKCEEKRVFSQIKC